MTDEPGSYTYLVELDQRRRVALGKIGNPEHTRYLVTQESDGRLIFTPAVVLPQATLEQHPELATRIEAAQQDPTRLIESTGRRNPTEYEIATYIHLMEQGLIHRMKQAVADAVHHWVWAHMYLTGDPTKPKGKPKGNPQGILPYTDPPKNPNRHPSTWGRAQGTK